MDTRKFVDTEWVKANINTKDGDHLRFLDEGKIESNREGVDQLITLVGIVRNGELIAQKKFQVNRTNNKAIAAVYGFDSVGWVNKEMRVNIIKKQNPQTGQLVDSVALSAPNQSLAGEVIIS